MIFGESNMHDSWLQIAEQEGDGEVGRKERGSGVVQE